MRKIAKKIISFLSKSELLYRFSKKIIDYHRNENNCEIETNGELDFIKKIKKNSRRFLMSEQISENGQDWHPALCRKREYTALSRVEILLKLC